MMSTRQRFIRRHLTRAPRLFAALVWCFFCMHAYAEDPVDSLHEAAKTGDVATIRRLVAGGLDVNAAREGGSPLLAATNWNRYEAVETLIALGADVNYKVGQWTPLMRAVGRDTRIVKALIDAGADVNYVDPIFGKSPLSYVAQNSPGIFEQLTKTGGYSGAFPDSVATTWLLVEAGADVNHKEKNGLTALRIAVSSNNAEIVRLLLKHDADVSSHTSVSRDSRTYTSTDNPILLDAVSGYPRISADIVANLLDAGADPNYREPRPYDASFDSSGKTTDGYTALTFAARWGYLPIVELLLRHGADPCLARADGALAATIADEHKFSRAAKAIGQRAKGMCEAPK